MEKISNSYFALIDQSKQIIEEHQLQEKIINKLNEKEIIIKELNGKLENQQKEFKEQIQNQINKENQEKRKIINEYERKLQGKQSTINNFQSTISQQANELRRLSKYDPDVIFQKEHPIGSVYESQTKSQSPFRGCAFILIGFRGRTDYTGQTVESWNRYRRIA